MSDMQTAYRVAALAVRQRFAEQHPDDLEVLNRISRDDVAAYSGSYDQVEEVLNCLEVPARIDPDARKLEARVVFANCSSRYEPALVERIAGHVAAGNWLVSSDWTLHYVLEKAFPDTVRWTKRSTGTEIVSVEPYQDSLWSEIVVLGADPQWWLWGSYPIEVVDPEKVSVEAASHDLLVRYNAPVVAVRFGWERGNVFHVISHFWAKHSRMPTSRHQGPCTDFLKAGMRLTDEGIARVLREAGVEPDSVNFAMLQSASTATELVAQICVLACREPRPDKQRPWPLLRA
jgi:hypothetical protein